MNDDLLSLDDPSSTILAKEVLRRRPRLRIGCGLVLSTTKDQHVSSLLNFELIDCRDLCTFLNFELSQTSASLESLLCTTLDQELLSRPDLLLVLKEK